MGGQRDRERGVEGPPTRLLGVRVGEKLPAALATSVSPFAFFSPSAKR